MIKRSGGTRQHELYGKHFHFSAPQYEHVSLKELDGRLHPASYLTPK